MRVLLVKMSSLGDVVHALPGVTDAAAALGDGSVSFDWVVEEAYAAVPARHPAVSRVIPIAWRRWRRNPAQSRREMRSFLAELRRQRYDLIVDAQGLMKSAAVTALARGRRRAGLSRSAAREGGASFFYGRQVAVPGDRHAIARIRILFAEALGYPLPETPLDYGLTFGAPAGGAAPPRCVLLHGTTWESKHWPVRFWQETAHRAREAGYQVLVPWGDESERRRAHEIAAPTGADVAEGMTLAELMDTLAAASLVVGVDSGPAHLAAALDVPTVVIYGSTSPALTGCRGRRVVNLQARFPCSPCLGRVCTYRGAARSWQGQPVDPACYATVAPDAVWRAVGAVSHR